MSEFLKKAVDYLGSINLAFILLVLLGVLTFVGTLEQQHMNLFDVQVKYFESIVLVYWVGDVVPIPLLGGYLLLTIFAINIIVGGIIRLRKGKSTVGILIGHIGIALLLVGSFVEHQFSTKGMMRLHEGETGSQYRSIHEWEVLVRAVKPAGGATEYIIPQKHFDGLGDSGSTRYSHGDLPFEIVLEGYARNSEPRRVTPAEASRGIGADGFVINELTPVGASSKLINLPGLTATVHPAKGGKAERAVLWGGARLPWAITRDGVQFQVELRRRTWDLPFSVQLKRFVHKRHAGTSMAKEFSSYVTKIQGGKARDIHITMNEPLRHQGVTLYQSGWGPQDAGPGARMFSDFSVVANPSDQVPLWACIVIALGLLIHLIRRLYLHLKAEGRRRANAQSKGQTA